MLVVGVVSLVAVLVSLLVVAVFVMVLVIVLVIINPKFKKHESHKYRHP
jgi:hypothetical protein